MLGKIFLDVALGAAYTPLTISPDGLVYAQNNGHLFVVGSPFRETPVTFGRQGNAPYGRAPRPGCGGAVISLELRVRQCPGSSVGRARD